MNLSQAQKLPHVVREAATRTAKFDKLSLGQITRLM